MVKQLQKLSLLLVACLWLGSGERALAQINISKGLTVTQRFSSIGTSGISTLPSGWKVSKDVNVRVVTPYASASEATERAADKAISTTASNGIYNFGTGPTDTDRAIGFLSSNSATKSGNLYVALTNSGTETINSLKLNYTVEKYRKGSNSAGYSIQLYYSTDGTNWESAGSNFKTSFAADADNTGYAKVPGDSMAVTDKVLNVPIAAGATFYLAWNYSSTTGTTTSNSQALAIDDIVIEADNTPPTLVSTTPVNGASNVATNLDLVLTFSESIVAETGNVTLYWGESSMTKSAKDIGNEIDGRRVIIRSVELLPNTTYTVAVGTDAFKDGVGNIFIGIPTNTWTFTTAAIMTPTIVPAVSSFTFTATEINKLSAVQSYELDGENLTGDITVTVTGPFQIAKRVEAGQGIFGTGPLTFTQTEIDGGEKVFVRFAPTAITGNTGAITHTSPGAQNAVVTLTGYGYNAFVQNFNDENFLTTSGWTQVSVAGNTNKWSYTSVAPKSAPGAAIMNGFSEAGASNDWLISPAMDLNNMANYPVLSFQSREFFSGPDLKLYVSTTYDGSGVIDMNQWTEITNADFPTATGVWKLSDGIDLSSFKSATTYIAFVYQTTAGGANNTSEWKIDDVKVENKTDFVQVPAYSIVFGETAPNTVSESRAFNVSAAGNGDLTVTAPAEFQVSLDNSSFASSVVVPAASALASVTVHVRFAPISKAVKMMGQIKVTSQNGLDVNGPKVSGNSYPRSETFDVASYNMQFFGNGTQIVDVSNNNRPYGPVNIALQITNTAEVFKKLGADIIGVQEISDEAALNEMIAKLPAGYEKNISQVYSYSIKPPRPGLYPAQKVGFIYNTATVTPVSSRVMFLDLYKQAVDRTTTLIDDDFWSSGRLPYLGVFDVTVNGKTQRVHMINIHAKSGSDAADYERRKFDIQVLTDSLNAHYANANIILLGDYNDDVSKSTRGAAYPTTFQPLVGDIANYTTLTFALSQAGAFTYPSSGSFLDHIIVSNEFTDEYIAESITIDDARDYVTNYSSTTSDHLPVYARFALTDSDQATIAFVKASEERTEGTGTYVVELALDKAVSIAPQTVKLQVANGTGITSSDYTINGHTVGDDGTFTLTIPANQTTVNFSVNVLEDTQWERFFEKVTFTLTSPSNWVKIGVQNSFVLDIKDNESIGSVGFQTASSSKEEDTGSTTVTVQVQKAAAFDIGVRIHLNNNSSGNTTATYEQDFSIVGKDVQDDNFTVTIPAGQTSASFDVLINDDEAVEEDEKIALAVSFVSPENEVGIYAPTADLNLTITDNDKATVSFVLSTINRQELRGDYTVNLALDKPSVLAQTVTLTVTNNEGVTYGTTGDYTTTPAVNNGTVVVTIPAGQTTASFVISPINDAAVESDEVIKFEITAVGDKLAIGEDKTFFYTIQNDDTPTGIGEELAGKFSVSPNPTTGEATLQLPENVIQQGKLTLVVYSLQGKVVLQASGTEQSLNSQLTNVLKSIAAGMYLVKVQAGDQAFQTRIVKR